MTSYFYLLRLGKRNSSSGYCGTKHEGGSGGSVWKESSDLRKDVNGKRGMVPMATVEQNISYDCVSRT